MNAVLVPAVTTTSLDLVELINAFRREQADNDGAAFPSKGYAELTHADFLKKVPEVLGSEVAGNFSGKYLASNGKANPMYVFPKREACLMAMSYSYELQARVFDRMTALEDAQRRQQPLSRLEILQHALEAEQAKLAMEAERDHAIATKAEIGSRREATAMATASRESRRAARLEEELGRGTKQATITAVERALGTTFAKNAYVPLRDWCRAHGVVPDVVPCPRYGTVKAWPAGAWRDAYEIELVLLFGMSDDDL